MSISFTVPQKSLRFRWNAIACAVAIFIWSTPEEDRPIFPAVLGLWLALSLAVAWVIGRFGGRTLRGRSLFTALIAFGAVAGAATSVCAALLMVFKDARHAHPFPDFPPALLGATLARLPAWALAGALVGLGVALFLVALNRRRPDTPSSAEATVL